jgi:macrolide transport system ATP-binding/permease protein
MGRSPAVALVIALSLGLGIGANTAIFSLIRSVLVKSLPVQDPDQLVLLHWFAEEWPHGLKQSGSGGPDNPAYRAASRSLAYPSSVRSRTARRCSTPSSPSLRSAASAEATRRWPPTARRNASTAKWSPATSSVACVRPAIGRTITVDDERADAHVAVISYAYWTRRFGGEPSILGKPITINNLPFTIVGVAPAQFFGVQPGRSPEVFICMIGAQQLAAWGYGPAGTQSLLAVRDYWWAHVIARLKPGVSEAQARATADGLFQHYVPDALPLVSRDHPPHIGFEPAAGGLDMLRSTYKEPLYLMMGMVALILLIACANVAVLLLSRAMARRRELALRLSLGADRARLIRQLLTDSLLMAAAGGALGVLCAGWTSRALLFLVPAERRPLLGTEIDVPILIFAAAVSAGTALLFGLAPAFLATRVEVLPALKQTASGTVTSDHPAHKIWSTSFVVVQVALSLVLLVGAMLVVRTLTNLQRQSLGLDDDRLLVFGVDPSQNGYSGDRLIALYGDLIHRLEAIPRVESASAARLRLFSGWVSKGSISVPGITPKSSMNAQSNTVGPHFARTTGIRALSGRDIDWSDIDSKRRVVVVNEEMARYFFGDLNVVGKRFNFGETPDPAEEYEIIGVVSNAKYSQVRGNFPRTAYLPYTAGRSALQGMYLHVRTSADPTDIASAVRTVLQNVNSSIAIIEMDSMRHQVGDSLWQERLFARLTSAFSALALTLACVGSTARSRTVWGDGGARLPCAWRSAPGMRRCCGSSCDRPLSWPFSVSSRASRWRSGVAVRLDAAVRPRPWDPATIGVTAPLLIAVASLAATSRPVAQP